MLLGCCHCGSESVFSGSIFSDSTLPSASDGFPAISESAGSESESIASSSVGVRTKLCADTLCIAGVTPLAYGLDVANAGGAAVCAPRIYGHFTLNIVEDSCATWRGGQRFGTSGALCIDIANTFLYGLQFSLSGSDLLIVLTLTYLNSGLFIARTWQKTVPAPANCLSTFVLDIVGGDDATAFTRPATVTIYPE